MFIVFPMRQSNFPISVSAAIQQIQSRKSRAKVTPLISGIQRISEGGVFSSTFPSMYLLQAVTIEIGQFAHYPMGKAKKTISSWNRTRIVQIHSLLLLHIDGKVRVRVITLHSLFDVNFKFMTVKSF